MFDHMLYVEMRVRGRPSEIAREVELARIASRAGYRPLPLRRVFAGMALRLAVVLDRDVVPCPDAAPAPWRQPLTGTH